MSSLSAQLSQIATANQTVALDRKKRSKLHSVSLVYDAKFAATQDYDSIYASSLDALEELEKIDRRFGRFKATIFSESSINVDRLVQSKEQNDNLNSQINVFLNLLSPYWHLSISLKAAEWPLRRFQMNVHNTEELLLTTLPFFNQPVFNRILYIIPQQNFPNIFQWLFNFKKMGKLPSQNVLIKAFTDLDFHNFYCKFLIQQLSHKNQSSKQLIFYISCSISSIVALQSNDFTKLSELTPIVLETCGELLKSTDDQDCQITAYTVLSVLASSIPLSKDVLFACIESILTSSKLTRQSLACILKLYQTLQSFEIMPLKFITHLKNICSNEEFKDLIFKDIKLNSKFVTSYIRGCIINGEFDKDLFQFAQLYKPISNSNFKMILKQLLANPTPEINGYFKWLINLNKSLFLETLNESNFELSKLEMDLKTALVDEDIDNDEVVIEDEEQQEESQEPAQDLVDLCKANKSDVKSFLVSNSTNNKAFTDLVKLYISALDQKSFTSFNKYVFPTPESSISFLLRVTISKVIPIRARLQAIFILRRRFKEILKRKTSLFFILPILLALLADSNQSIRTGGLELISTINTHEQDKIEDDFFLSQNIYGPNSDQIASLNAKDIKPFYSKILESGDLYKLDRNQIFEKLVNLLESDKKNNKLYYAIFVSHGLVNNLPGLKLFFLKLVIDGKSVVKGVSLPSQLFDDFLKNYFDDRSTWEFNCQDSNIKFEEFEKTVVSLVSQKEKNHSAIEFLLKGVLSEDSNLSKLCVDKIIEIFPHLKSDFQQEILIKIIDSNSSIDPVEILQSLNLTGDMFNQLLKKTTLTQTTEGVTTVKRRRRSSQTTRQALKDSSVAKIATDHLKKITIILEVLVSTKIEEASFELLQKLFNVLSDLETLDNDGNLPVIYTQETLASCMLNVVNALKTSTNKKTLDNSLIRADSIIATIRSSSSPQVQNKLLLVVAAMASLIPETILHSVMPIFTFMGAHTIRQDDEFSNHVVEQTILCVVPALAEAAENGQVEEIEFLTTSFVSAFQHIPRHRRVKLFTTLAKTLGVQYSVSLILFLCGQQYSSLYGKHKMADCRSLLEFTSSFLKNFQSEEQLSGILEFLKLWNLIPLDQLNPESESYKQLLSRSVFGINILSLTKLELFNLRNNMLTFLDQSIVGNNDLSSLPHLRIKIASTLLDSNTAEIAKINDSFSSLVQYILNDCNPEEEEISNNLYKLLGDILNLLPIQQFIDSVLSVIKFDSKTADLKVKRHLTILTGTKFELESTDDLFAQDSANRLIPVLIENIESQKDVELSQSSLDTLSAIFQKFNNKLDPSLLVKSLTIIVGDSGLLFKDSPEILISSINCITSIVSTIGVKMIGLFPKIVPPVFKIFYESQEYRDREILQISILILFSCLIKKLPVFMLSNLQDVIKVIFNAKTIPESTRLSILDVIVQHMNLKEVLKSLTAVWSDVSKLDPVAIGLYLHTMELTIENIDKKTASAESIHFVKFLLFAFEYRSQSKLDGNTIHRIEASLFQCGISYVMKLNDKSFRPLFASVSRWAFDGEGAVSDISEIDRLLAFFRFFNKLQENLKSIITNYYSYLLENVEKILARYSNDEIKDINLRRLILISLTSSFKYDQDEFWSTETRFEVISKSLTEQLVNIEDGIGKYLVKAISSLAQTCSSDDHNKSLSELMTKHLNLSCNAREKYWAARSMKLIYQKVGDQWLSLIPQLVPLIAELLEDDDEEVEQEVRNGWIKSIEAVLGEPLDRYLD